MTLQVAFYKADGQLMDRLIRRWTKSPYSHCELVCNGVAYGSSPRDGGVRAKLIEWNPDHWDFLEIGPDIYNNYGKTDEEVLKWFKDHYRQGYDWLGLLWFVFPFRFWQLRNRWFCSEAVAESFGMHESWSMSPEKLYRRLRQLNPNIVDKIEVGLPLMSV